MAFLSVALLSPAYPVAVAQQTPAPEASGEEAPTQTALPEEEAPKIPNDQLDSLVAPVALYPDPLLSQTLVASTYPLEVVQLQQWMEKNKGLKDKALADAVAKQPWDPSIQSMAAFPDVVTRLGDNIAWTTDLGNAFLAQQGDVMDAVQRMRAKAESKGTLKTNAQQTVQTETVEDGKQAIVIQPASSDVVYVPSYDPAVVYGAAYPAYPYPPVYYPGYVAGMGLAFGTGLVLGAAWGGGWGYGCGWGNGNVNINNNNNYVNHYNKANNINRGQGGGNWQHNPSHRGPVPYNKGAANKYGQRPGQRPGGGAGGVGRPGGPGGVGRPAVPVALEDRAEPAALESLAVPEGLESRVDLVALESLAVPVGLESPVVPVGLESLEARRRWKARWCEARHSPKWRCWREASHSSEWWRWRETSQSSNRWEQHRWPQCIEELWPRCIRWRFRGDEQELSSSQ